MCVRNKKKKEKRIEKMQKKYSQKKKNASRYKGQQKSVDAKEK